LIEDVDKPSKEISINVLEVQHGEVKKTEKSPLISPKGPSPKGGLFSPKHLAESVANKLGRIAPIKKPEQKFASRRDLHYSDSDSQDSEGDDPT